MTTPDADANVYKTAGGKNLVIDIDKGGFWIVRTTEGGVPPTICHERFTTKSMAEKALVKYLSENDSVLKTAIYPGAPPSKFRKPKTNGES